MAKDKPSPPPWRAGKYTPVPNDLAQSLAGSVARHDLSARAAGTLLVMFTETWGHRGDRYRQFGRAAAPISVSALASTLGVDPKTVRRALAELKEKGWARMVSPPSGQRAATWEPSIRPPARPELQAVPEEEPESDREVTEADRA
ncbi:MAG TPA: helix-turn-helix domain-containing protein, partial [Candidatus Limnocylindrales bacterium]